MVYGYSTNEEFIDKSYQLLEKLEAKGLWNADTLVIGLDKSVRPLAYTLRKLSDLEGKEKPDMRFFNYNRVDREYSLDNVGEILRDTKDVNKISKRYKKILVLDEHAEEGKTILETRDVLKKSFSKSQNKPLIKIATISTGDSELEKKGLIYISDDWISSANKEDTAIEDRYYKSRATGINRSEPIHNKETRQKFLENRYQLSKDIKNYLQKKHPEKISKSSSLEKIVKPISIFIFALGILLSSKTITGNVIGSFSNSNFLGAILIVFGIVGFFVNRKLKQ